MTKTGTKNRFQWDARPAALSENVVFPGADNTFALYEDSGDGFAYKEGAFAQTEMTLSWGEMPTFTVGPAFGDLTLIPECRNWRIGLRGFHKDIAVQVLVNGEKAESLLTRNAGDNTLWIAVTAPVTAKIQVQISGSERIHDNSDVTERCIRLLDRTQCLYDQKTAVLEWIQDTRWDLRERLLHVGAYKLNIDSLASAIVELLTLTEDKFLGSQIPD